MKPNCHHVHHSQTGSSQQCSPGRLGAIMASNTSVVEVNADSFSFLKSVFSCLMMVAILLAWSSLSQADYGVTYHSFKQLKSFSDPVHLSLQNSQKSFSDKEIEPELLQYVASLQPDVYLIKVTREPCGEGPCPDAIIIPQDGSDDQNTIYLNLNDGSPSYHLIYGKPKIDASRLFYAQQDDINDPASTPRLSESVPGVFVTEVTLSDTSSGGALPPSSSSSASEQILSGGGGLGNNQDFKPWFGGGGGPSDQEVVGMTGLLFYAVGDDDDDDSKVYADNIVVILTNSNGDILRKSVYSPKEWEALILAEAKNDDEPLYLPTVNYVNLTLGLKDSKTNLDEVNLPGIISCMLSSSRRCQGQSQGQSHQSSSYSVASNGSFYNQGVFGRGGRGGGESEGGFVCRRCNTAFSNQFALEIHHKTCPALSVDPQSAARENLSTDQLMTRIMQLEIPNDISDKATSVGIELGLTCRELEGLDTGWVNAPVIATEMIKLWLDRADPEGDRVSALREALEKNNLRRAASKLNRIQSVNMGSSGAGAVAGVVTNQSLGQTSRQPNSTKDDYMRVFDELELPTHISNKAMEVGMTLGLSYSKLQAALGAPIMMMMSGDRRAKHMLSMWLDTNPENISGNLQDALEKNNLRAYAPKLQKKLPRTDGRSIARSNQSTRQLYPQTVYSGASHQPSSAHQQLPATGRSVSWTTGQATGQATGQSASWTTGQHSMQRGGAQSSSAASKRFTMEYFSNRLSEDLKTEVAHKYLEIGIKLGMTGQFLRNELDIPRYFNSTKTQKFNAVLALWVQSRSSMTVDQAWKHLKGAFEHESIADDVIREIGQKLGM